LFEKLKFLNLSHSHHLAQTPDFAGLPNLEKLILKDCTNLFEVHQSIGDLNNLVFVNLEGCRSLQSLPKSFYRLKSLQTLILSGCSRLDNLAEELGEMESLTTFLADNTAIRQVPWTIVRLKNLKYLSLCGCRGPPSKSFFSLFCSWIFPRKSPISVSLLPASLQGLNSLRKLNLSHCNLTDDAIPKDLGSLCALQSLVLQNNHFHSLPSSLGGLSKLQTLILDNCTNLQSITDLPPNLEELRAADCTTLERMPSLGGFSKLQSLILDNCANLQSITDLPPNLLALTAENCTTWERMPNLSNFLHLVYLFLTNCNKLAEIPGLDKLLKRTGVIIRLDQCCNLTYNFKKSILQVLSLSLSLVFVYIIAYIHNAFGAYRDRL
jgi:Leucine-rich repeat (LRR) protein